MILSTVLERIQACIGDPVINESSLNAIRDLVENESSLDAIDEM
jgi:hypothetical protein